MAVEERDPHSGYLTTGHEWNGIKELNTPVPRVVFVFLALTFAFSLVYWLLMPSFPVGTTYLKGLLGVDQRTAVTEELRRASASRAAWARRIETADYATIRADPNLMGLVRETGRPLFGDNCAVCHGTDAKGGPGFPNLTSGSWLWGGKPEDVARTLQVGINAAHPDTRASQMLAFGRDGMLSREDVDAVAAYVQSLSDRSVSSGPDAASAAAGAKVFASKCVACHGPAAKGSTSIGAPDLTDAFWIYGGDRSSIRASIWGGRQGHMPSWEARLTDLDRKILTLYVLDLGARAP
ncbi:cytochrome-c oxidase, cbb3-type subunit III [Hansschlegelia zhihuaiae]|uniref:Cbb3-type cytochrome c oxidase subunit n=1 Tax=Hansschlegelia zhihuaiae TaxID=405005 RepID=A0A4Q0MC47_9HYPH|nr:cytochrome-c oxidase, cbb3-type subunit III [Hansschlegelia zhihuaiae]RXF70908.1 cytochrome-c oxidase, cbb3-type subunit III [Hansschlegelia zhihuaiae]